MATQRFYQQTGCIIESEVYKRFKLLGNKLNLPMQDIHRQAIIDYIEKHEAELQQASE